MIRFPWWLEQGLVLGAPICIQAEGKGSPFLGLCLMRGFGPP